MLNKTKHALCIGTIWKQRQGSQYDVLAPMTPKQNATMPDSLGSKDLGVF